MRNKLLIVQIALLFLCRLTVVAQTHLDVRPVTPQQQWQLSQQRQPDKLIHTQGYYLLKPLTQIKTAKAEKAQKRPVLSQTRKTANTSVTKAGKLPVNIYGTLVYTSQGMSGRYGIYSISGTDGTITAVHKDNAFNFNGGAIYDNGKYNFINYTVYWSYIFSYDYYQYNTEDWSQAQHVSGSETHCMVVDGDHNNADGKNYAIMYTDGLDKQVFGTVDYEKNSRTIIKNLDKNFLCMAISPEGKIYAVCEDGNLCEFTTAGTYKVIGATGLTPSYVQSAAIDPSTGTMYWAACSKEDTIGLYTVDLTSGAATLVKAFEHNEEFSGLYIPAPLANEDAPAATSAQKVSFSDGSLTGTVSFTMPTTTYANEALSGSLTYHVYVNDSLYTSGTANAGETAQATITVPEDGEYTIRTSAENSVGEGPRTDKTTLWIGYDQPLAPTSVAFTLDKNVTKVSWKAPVKGTNGGYVDSNLTYNIVRMPDSVVIAQGVTATTVSDTIPDQTMRNLYYRVTAVNQGHESEAGESSRKAYGTAFEVPYTEDFTDLTDFDNLFTIIDANKDGSTWKRGYWNSGVSDAYYEYNKKNAADDWLITPPIHLKAGHFYNVGFSVNCSFYGDERLETAYGKDKTAAAMTNIIRPAFMITSSTSTPYTDYIQINEDGNYYFGFHALSDANMGILDFDDISVTERGQFTAPDTVHALTATPGNRGASTCLLSFVTPQTDFNGDPITKIDSIEIYRNGVRIHTIENPALGETLTYNDTKASTGRVKYEVYTSNEHGKGIPAIVTPWVGVDIPTVPTDVKLVQQGNYAKLSWKAPTTGVHGGYVNPGALTYNIEDNSSYIKGDHRAGTTYSEYRDASKQDLLYYRVSAQSAAGGGDYAYSDTILYGNPYKLPFMESWANATTKQFWSQQNTGGEIGLTKGISADHDNGSAIFKPAANGDQGMITSGKITLKGANHPVVDYYYYAVPGQKTSLSLAAVPDGDNSKVAILNTINYSQLTGKQGWRKVSVDLSGYKDYDYIMLSWVGVAYAANAGDIAFDAIDVHETYDVDLKADLSVPEMVEVGQEDEGQVIVSNVGLNDVETYDVNVYQNGKLLTTLTGTPVAAGETSTLAFDIIPAQTDDSLNTFKAEVVASGDGDASNNVSATDTVAYIQNMLPAPTALAGEAADGNITLSWTAPDLTVNNVVTESFEDAKPWSIDHILGWTTRDLDGDDTQTLVKGDGTAVQYNHVGEPMAWQVFNPSAAGLTGSTIDCYTGKQMLANIVEANSDADDWLISPALSGEAQTVSFWTRSVSKDYIESFEVLYSTSDTATASFQSLQSTTAPADWTEFSFSLPSGARYFAIHVTGKQKFMLMLDDVTYSPFTAASLKLLGYNVYQDNTPLNNGLVSNVNCVIPAYGAHTYRVSAVYNLGESRLSTPWVCDEATAITDVVSPVGVKGCYSVDGKRLSNPVKGVNIIQHTNGKTAKVIKK